MKKNIGITALLVIGLCMLPRTVQAQTGILKGTAKDAGDQRPLGNVRVAVAGLSTLTNSSGEFIIAGVPTGTASAAFVAAPTQGTLPLAVQFADFSSEGRQQVTATVNGYQPFSSNHVLILPNDTTTLDFRMVPVESSNAIRMVLRWDALPQDLDVHLKTPAIGGAMYEVKYNSRGSASFAPFAMLDNDFKTGFGPEAITIYQTFAGTYRYFVHIFNDNPTSPADTSFAGSNAFVEIVNNSTGASQIIFVPTTGTGRWWYVCDIDGVTKTVTIVNQIQTQPPSASPDNFLSKGKHDADRGVVFRPGAPDTIRRWQWSFGDGGTSALRNPTHTYQAVGTYNVSLTVFTDNLQATTTQNNLIAVSFLQTMLTSDSVVNSPQVITTTTPGGFQTVSARLIYRLGGSARYDSVAFDTSQRPYRGTIPASAVTLRGLEYYIALTGRFAGGGLVRITHPPTDPELNPIRLRTKSASSLSAVTLQSRVYRMISVPAELTDASVSGVLFDDFGAYDPNRWRLFRWKANAYVEYPALTDAFTPGNAFWIISDANHQFNVGLARSTMTTQSATVVLDTGWNQIGNPFAFPVAWRDVQRFGNIQGPYFYDGTSYTLDTNSSVLPWEGYFVYNAGPGSARLEFPPRGPGNSSLPKSRSSAESYTLSLSAELDGTGLRDAQNAVGFVATALDGDDGFDFRKPPAVSNDLRLAIVDNGRQFMRNFKPARTGEGQEWRIEITNTHPQVPVTLRLSEEGVLPEGFHIFLFDEDDFNAVPIQGNAAALRFQTANEVKHLKLIIGTREYAEGHSNGIPLAPVAYALDQNYPNPFNPTTTIRYQLSKRGDVVLEVYNVLGQKVRTLVQHEQRTGEHAVQWQGDDDRGLRVASGVYIYRLHAGDFTASRKLLLLR